MTNSSRFKAIIASRTARALDAVDDPRDALDASYDQQFAMLQQARRGLADIATARKRIELQGQEAESRYRRLESQARRALHEGLDDVARTALERRASVAAHLQTLQTEHQRVQQREVQLQETERRLAERFEAFRVESETMKATYAAAVAQVTANEAVAGIGSGFAETEARIDRARIRIERVQARADATDELLRSGVLSSSAAQNDSDLDRRLGARNDAIERQLIAMRAELSTPENGDDERGDGSWLSVSR